MLRRNLLAILDRVTVINHNMNLEQAELQRTRRPQKVPKNANERSNTNDANHLKRGRRACGMFRTSPHLLISIALTIKTRKVSCSIPSRAARRGEDSLLSKQNYLVSGAKPNPKFHLADVPI
jgi:hypothetical protein